MAIVGTIKSIVFFTDGGETWVDLTGHVARWPERVPYCSVEIDPALLVNAQVYALTDGVQ